MATDSQDGLEVSMVGQVTVARFAEEIVLSGNRAEAAGERLGALLAAPGCRLLLDFARVRSLSSLMLGKLVTLNRVAEASAGKLVLCNLRPEIRDILEITRLSAILSICAGEQEGLQSFS